MDSLDNQGFISALVIIDNFFELSLHLVTLILVTHEGSFFL